MVLRRPRHSRTQTSGNSASERLRSESRYSELDPTLAPTPVDNVNEPYFVRVMLEEYPVHVVHNAVKRRVIAMALSADARLARYEFAESIQVVDESIGARSAELPLDISGDRIGIVHEACREDDAH